MEGRDQIKQFIQDCSSVGQRVSHQEQFEKLSALFDTIDQLRADLAAQREKNCLVERIAQIQAHRACIGAEHDPLNGKLHGCCVVCGVPFPCDYVGGPQDLSNVVKENDLC